MSRKVIELVRVGDLVAEVEVDYHDDAGVESPALNLADARKLELVRAALELNDIAAAGKLAQVYRMPRQKRRAVHVDDLTDEEAADYMRGPEDAADALCPNALTAETLRKSRKGEDLFHAANAADLFKKLGI